jgi:PLP dependent protein
VNTSIGDRIQQIQQKLPSTVKLIAISKYAPVAAIRAAYQAGIRDFGESRVQEAIAKKQELQDLSGITWHLIGTLQSNKSRLAVANFDWIHSVDRLSLAQQLNRLASETLKSPNSQLQVCLQVKLADDPHKSGWEKATLIADLSELRKCQHLAICGLMTILPLGLTLEESYQIFKKVADLKSELQFLGWENITHLSMGMSQDYDAAIRAGATMIRIGSKIFS